MTAPDPGKWSWDAVATLPVAVVGIDAKGVIGLWNDGATALMGWERSDALGRNVLDLVIGPGDAPTARRMTPGVLDGETWEGRFPVVRRDGSKLLVSVISVPVQLGPDERGLLNIIRDATTAFENESERDRLLAAEQHARRSAEDMAERLTRLQVLTENLATAVTVQDVLDTVVTTALGSLGMASATVCAVDGDDLVVLAVAGVEEETTTKFARFPLTAELPESIAARRGEPTYLSSMAERDERFPVFRDLATGHQASAVLPLEVEGRRLGAVSFGWSDEHPFDDDDRRFLGAIADQCGSAMERARLAEAERRALHRQAFLATASRELASSLDLDATIARAARLLVPELASSSAVYLLEEDGLRLVAVANADAEKERSMWALNDLVGARARSPQLAEVVASNEPWFSPEIPAHVWESNADDDEQLGLLRELEIRGGMAVPLRGHGGEVVGVVAATRDGAREGFAPAETSLILELSERVGISIANASAHRRRIEVARTLQQSLLPPRQPDIPGLDLSARYHPVGDGSEVGGDFYDVFRLDDHHWGVVMGDVSGKGVAAASLTALARYTVRAASTWELTPSAVLRTLNRAILEDETSERFCTLCLAFIRVEGDRATVTLSVGGHPLPMLVGDDGSVKPVGVFGTGIGLFASPEVADVELELKPGDVLVLYTDGVIEARSPEGHFAPDLMEQALRQGPWSSATQVADAVDHAVIAFEGGTPRDDMAVLVVRMPAVNQGDEVSRLEGSYEAAMTSATRARREFVTWLETSGLDAANDMVMVVAELAANAARAARSRVSVRAWIEDNDLVVEVEDDGTGIPGALPETAAMPDVSAEQGRGLYLVRLLTDSCTIATGPGGTIIRVTQRL